MCVCVCVCVRVRSLACVSNTHVLVYSKSNIIVLDWVLTSVCVCVCVCLGVYVCVKHTSSFRESNIVLDWDAYKCVCVRACVRASNTHALV